ncbi:mediator of RNA polymerase II transcription subunit 12 [Podospora conica]|nr:mediator of RNA polymerase II transcription subunit 12 [Schizothecium conicum]
MTSRPPLGGPQRPPSRKPSAPGLSQRPPSAAARQRTHLPPSPIRRETSFHDFTPTEPTDASQARFAPPRRGGSRLKLELSHDAADPMSLAAFSESPHAMDSSKSFTPSRMVPPTEPSDLSDMSPHLAPQTDPDAPMPMPTRPPIFTTNLPRREPPPAPANPPKKDTRPKPYTVEVPAAAPRYVIPGKGKGKGDAAPRSGAGGAGGVAGSLGPSPSLGYVDFFPWTGMHPEDQFSENAIRNGYFDKAPTAQQAETQSAKQILFPALKHNNGLTGLSNVFASIIAERRHGGQITAPSTFKPPPRVTLTDTKREIWLKDLANPAISLRRLSRTIPHGIRGKILLEQCMNKKVPTDRAVWLARCVGINELRSFKRKGAGSSLVIGGGEAKFHKEWTGIVEQYLESVLFGLDDPDYKVRVGYAVRLATNLYAEHLLDREHFMEWLVHSFENCEQDKLPMWILLTEIYWKDLLKLRKYGRRLVTTLVRHHHEIQIHVDRDLFQSLCSKLTALLDTLILSSPENFVHPSTWSKYRDTLKLCLPVGDVVRQNAFSALCRRNEQLVASVNRSQPAARHILVKKLDGTLQAPLPDDLPIQCWGISKDKTALVRTLLEWCTSLYRPDLAKIFVSSRILQQWGGLGLDTTTAILEFLDGNTLEETGRKDALYHLVCELVRTGAFSVSRYLQWLVAGGPITNPADMDPDGPSATRLLVELPMHTLRKAQKRTRSAILRRASFPVDDEEKNTDLAIQYLKQALGLPIDMDSPVLQKKALSLRQLANRVRTKSHRSLKAEIGCWLQKNITTMVEQKEADGGQGPDMSPTFFHAVRTMLEAAGDYSMLAGILKSLMRQSNVETLASIADTVNRHFLIFSALGDAKMMFEGLHKRLLVLAPEQDHGVRPLLASLVGLAGQMPGHEELSVHLQAELTVIDRHSAVDACSPVSDSMASRLQDDDGALREEIEKNLASGTSLDRNTMNRLFQTLVQRLHECWDTVYDNQRAYSQLLARLRIFDTQHFDATMSKWLLSLRTTQNRPSILRIYPLLVSVGCLSLATIFSTTAEPPRPPGGNAAAPQVVQATFRTRYLQEVLKLFMMPIPEDGLILPDEAYRFSVLQRQACRDHSKDLLALIRLALAEYSYSRSQNDVENLPLDSDKVQDQLLELVKLLVLKDPGGVVRALTVRQCEPPVGSWIDYMTTKLLIPTADQQTHVSFDQVLALTNEFTLPFCQVKLSLSLASADQSSPEAADRQQMLLELFANAMDKAIDARNMSWMGMLSFLSPETTHHLKSRAQMRFLDLLPSIRTPSPPAQPLDHTLQMADSLLSVIDAIIRSGTMGRPPQLVASMIDKLADLWEVLAAADPAPKPAVLAHWLPSLLNFLTLHTQTFDTSRASAEVRAKALVICTGLLHELDALHAGPADTRALATRIFDLACVLADNVPDDARAMCARALRDATGDARVRYIFSVAAPGPEGAETIMLAQRDKTVAAATAPRRGGQGLPQMLGTPAALWGVEGPGQGAERLSPFAVRRWELLSEPTPAVGENDTALSLGLFEARRV